MKKYIFSLSLVVALGLSSCGNAQSSEESTASSNTAQGAQIINKDVDVNEFEKLVAEGNGLLLDVRTNDEFAESHLNGATQIDFFSNDFQDQVKKLDRETPVYIYCRSGRRSGKAADLMKGMGFKAVYNLEGGILAWQSAGKTVEK